MTTPTLQQMIAGPHEARIEEILSVILKQTQSLGELLNRPGTESNLRSFVQLFQARQTELQFLSAELSLPLGLVEVSSESMSACNESE